MSSTLGFTEPYLVIIQTHARQIKSFKCVKVFLGTFGIGALFSLKNKEGSSPHKVRHLTTQ